MALQFNPRVFNRRLGRASLLISTIIAITLPSIYGFTAIHGERTHLKAEAQQNAKALSQMVFRYPDTWLFQLEKIEDVLKENALHHALVTSKQVVDSSGQSVITLGRPKIRFRLTEVSKIYSGPEPVGVLVVSKDIAPVITRIGLVGLLGLLLGGAINYILRVSPMRALADAAAEVEMTADQLASEIIEREAVEARLRQSQKLEALGQLTGGIAHDFNNLLAIIQGNADLWARKSRGGKKYVDPILRAAERGSNLTQRLLAFARKQQLSPADVNVAGLVEGMLDLLRRSLGETIEIETVVKPDLWHALADAAQVENAILNLALNARAAMPNGGKLTICCSNVHIDEVLLDGNTEISPGDYIRLTVTDNGTGMSPDILEHALEPFFTTKPVGEGTGLGLSMVYGFAKQSGGHVAIYSEEGQGTSVKLYLPRDKATRRHQERQVSTKAPQGRGECILVIEDEDDVRKVAVEMLDSLNYRVADVATAAQAQALLEGGERFDLVLSDVVLPGGMSGPEFAEQAIKDHPDLKALFMSGYPADAAHRNGLIGVNGVLLNKPFRRPQLAQAIREMLDGV